MALGIDYIAQVYSLFSFLKNFVFVCGIYLFILDLTITTI